MAPEIVCFGELMIRLKSPGKQRLLQTPVLEVSYGGAEANVAWNLAYLGAQAGFITVLPEGPLGDAALGFLRQGQVDVSGVRRSKGRMGLYFLEEGAAQRPSRVVYDRESSAVACAGSSFYSWKENLAGSRFFHVSGITPALSPEAAEAAGEALKEAGKLGLTRSLDLNYRKNLWKYGKTAREVMPALAGHCEILFSNEEDLQLALGWEALDPWDDEALRGLCRRIRSTYPGIRLATVTLRTAQGADRNRWEALALKPATEEILRSRAYTIEPVVDRVGAGDSFAAGILLGESEGWNLQDSLEFAAAYSCLKHSVPGDQAPLSRAEVSLLLSGDGTGRVQR